ncbi:MAG: hypothetical protein RLZZ64_1466 [Bacteroidota bacterium]
MSPTRKEKMRPGSLTIKKQNDNFYKQYEKSCYLFNQMIETERKNRKGQDEEVQAI